MAYAESILIIIYLWNLNTESRRVVAGGWEVGNTESPIEGYKL